MNSTREPGSFEYPDEAGYPDGMGTLDEGTGGTVEDDKADEPEPHQPESDEAVDRDEHNS